MADTTTIPLVERLRAQAARHREHATGLASAALLEEAADALASHERGRRAAVTTDWRPISAHLHALQCNRGGLARGYDAMTSETIWVRTAEGRVFEAWWTTRGYWWDCDGETECEPVEWMPHPLWVHAWEG